MAANRWIGAQKKTAQVNTITPASVTVGNTFTVTINNKSVVFTATAGTVANVTAGLVALLQASTEPEFLEITWADATTAVTGTAKTPGKPFTQTSSAAQGSGSAGMTLVTSTTTANTSPSDLNDAKNWSAGSVPAGTDDVYIDTTSVPILWNLSALSAVTLNSLTISMSFQQPGQVGLPEINTDDQSNPYEEYRPAYLAIGATTVTIGDGSLGSGPTLIKINFGSVQTAVTVLNTGSSAVQGTAAVILKGTHASNVLNVYGGSVDSAMFGGEASTWATVRVSDSSGSQTQVRLGAGCTLTTVTQEGSNSDLLLRAAATTLNQEAGTCTVAGTGAITTINSRKGTIVHQGTGTVTTWNVGTDQVADLSQAMAALTVTNINLYAGCTWNDPSFRASSTANGLQLKQCQLSDVTINIGSNRTLVCT